MENQDGDESYETNQKQYFLRDEILNKGYDPNKFQEFLLTIKDDGTNIETWSFEDLKKVQFFILIKQVTYQFQTQQESGNINKVHGQAQEDTSDKIQNSNNVEEQQQAKQDPFQDISFEEFAKSAIQEYPESKQQTSDPDPKKTTQEQDEDVYDQSNIQSNYKPYEEFSKQSNFRKILNCKKLEKGLIGLHENFEVVILDHKIVQGNIFSSSYTYYLVKSYPVGWEVRRRYSDFEWLRTNIVKFYPGIIVPPIPSKSTMSSVNSETIAQRKLFFEHFLNSILKIPELKSSTLVLDFLQTTDETLFKNKIREVQKYDKPKSLEYIKNMKGYIDIIINDSNKKYMLSILKYTENQDIYFQKLRKILKEINENYQKISDSYIEMGQIFTDISYQTQVFNDEVEEKCKVFQLENCYKLLNNMSMLIGNSIKDQIKHLENHYLSFFTFQRQSNLSVKELIQTRNVFANEFYNKKQDEKKSNIFHSIKSGLQHQFQKSNYVDTPSQDILILQDQFGFYSQQLCEEGTRFLKDQADIYQKHFITFSSIQRSVTTEMQFIWEDINRNFTNLQQLSDKNNSHGKIFQTQKIELIKKI